MIVCICEHVQWRWAVNDSLAPRLIKVDNIITRTSHYESSTMSGMGYILKFARAVSLLCPVFNEHGLLQPRASLPFSAHLHWTGSRMHTITERAQYIAGAYVLSALR
jgi:hypothetical protein